MKTAITELPRAGAQDRQYSRRGRGRLSRVVIEGDMNAGAWSCGIVVWLINEVPTVKELIDRIMADAEAIIRERLIGFLDGVAERVAARGCLKVAHAAEELSHERAYKVRGR